MDLSRMKKVLAGVSAAAITLTQVASVFAAYSDVPSGVWFADSVNDFVDAGYLDASQARFRGSDLANRAEFVKLLVELNGGILSTPPAVPSFTDVASGAWYYGYMEEAGKEGWVRGDGNCYGSKPCYARPSANINRAEAAALIVRAFGLDWTGAAPQFVDNPSGQWYTNDIQTAADHCVLQGDDSTGRVRPSDNMNRAEMVVMLHRVDQGLTYGEDCGMEDTAEPAISDVIPTSTTTVEVEFNMMLDETAAMDADKYAVSGDSDLMVTDVAMIDDMTVELTFDGEMIASGDYTLSVDDMETAGGDMFSDSASFTGYSPVVRGDGTLEVSVAASNPVADSVPKGANGVVMLSMDLTASCDDDVVLEEITILHEGFGDEADLTGVYAAMDGGRITRKRTIDSEDQTSDLRFTAPLMINACDTVTVDVVGDFSTTATTSAEHDLAVELPSDLVGNAKAVEGNFPIRGNTFRIAAVTSGVVTVTYNTVSPDQVEVGDVAVGIGKFQLSTDSVEDQTIYSMTFEQNGSVSDGDLANIKVQRNDGTVLTNAAATTVGDFVTVVFDPPFSILEGDRITLGVVADIFGGAGDTIVMHFEESSDIFAVGSLYGYGLNGQLYGSQISLPTETSSLPDTVTVDAGEFTIEIDGPSQQSFTRDADDAVLANVLMTTGGESVDLKDLFVLIEAENSTGAALNTSNSTSYDNIHEVLEDVELRNVKTGRTISAVRLTGTSDFGQNGTTTSTFQVYRFDDFTVNGSEKWELRVDMIDNGTSASPRTGDKVRAHICGEPKKVLDSTNSLTTNSTGCTFGGIFASTVTSYQMDIEGTSTGDKVGDVRPRGTITGNYQRIANPQFNVAVKAIGTSETAVKNRKNVNLLRFEGRAGEAEDILLTKAIFKSDSGSLNNGQNYTLWVDTDGDSTVDTILQKGVAAQSSQVSFSDLAGGGYVIPAEETVIFEVHADIAASLTNDDLLLMFDTGSSVTYLEAEEVDDGSSLSGIKTGTTCSGTCNIIVTTTRSKLWNLVSQGDLFVTKDSTPTRSRQLLGGTLGDPILRLQLRGQNEAIDVTDFQFTGSGSISTSVDKLELYRDGDTSPFALATVGGCGSDDVIGYYKTGAATQSAATTFCANMENKQLVVPAGSDIDVIIRPRMKSDTSGGISNEKIQLFITSQAVSNNTTGSGAVRARGSESSNDLTANDTDTVAEGEIFFSSTVVANTSHVDILGNENTTVLAKLASVTNANPDPDNTNIPNGVNPFGQFKFTAAAHNNSLNGLNKWVLSGVIFNVSAINVNLNATVFKFYNKADTSTKYTCTSRTTGGTALVAVASGSFLVDCQMILGSSVDTKISQGENATFVLEGNVTNPAVTSSVTSTLQASIQDFTTKTTTGYGATTSHLSWLDQDTATTMFRWVEYGETVVKSTSYKS